MARTNNLTNFLTDVADAIRTKTGESGTIQASSFDTAISNIPSGGSSIDWSQIGYSEEPSSLQKGLDYAKDIYDNWDSSVTSMDYMFQNNKEIMYMPLVDTSNVTSMAAMFKDCIHLENVPLLDTSNVNQGMSNLFNGCNNLRSVPALDMSKTNNLNYAFKNCSLLEDVPYFNTPRNTDLYETFTGCLKLTDTSLDNILRMCISSTAYAQVGRTKTLNAIGITDTTVYPASRIQVLPHYQDFIDAGWTIGY